MLCTHSEIQGVGCFKCLVVCLWCEGTGDATRAAGAAMLPGKVHIRCPECEGTGVKPHFTESYVGEARIMDVEAEFARLDAMIAA